MHWIKRNNKLINGKVCEKNAVPDTQNNRKTIKVSTY